MRGRGPSATCFVALAGAFVLSAGPMGAAVASDAPAVCPQRWQAAAGPLPGGTAPADFAAIPEACSATDVGLRLRMGLLVASAMPDYYGSVLTGAMVRLRHPIGRDGWLSVAIDAVSFRHINNGGLASNGWAFGPPTAGYYHRIFATTRTSTAAYGRVLLPFDSARQSSVAGGLEVGATSRALLTPRWHLAGGAALAAPGEIVAGQFHGRLQPLGLAEVWFSLRPWVAFVAGATARGEVTPDPSLITVAPRLGGRVALKDGFSTALLAEFPVVGTDRTDLIIGLYGGWTAN